MGLGYYRPLTQWSKGEYLGADNKQDDIAIIRSKLGSAPVSSSGGSSLNTALPMAVAAAPSGKSATATASGVLATADAVAYYSFTTTAAGTVEVVAEGVPATADSQENLGNLYPLLKLYNEQGAVLATGSGKLNAKEISADLPGSVFGLGDSVVVLNLAAGVYKVSIEPMGYNSLQNKGYSTYGSLGQFSLTATLPWDETIASHSPPPPQPPPTGSVNEQKPPPSPPSKGQKTAQTRKILTRGPTSATARVVVTDAATAAPITNAMVLIKWEVSNPGANGASTGVVEQPAGFPYYSTVRANSRGFARVTSKPVLDPQVLVKLGFSVVSVSGQGVHWRLRGGTAASTASKRGNDQVGKVVEVGTQSVAHEEGMENALKNATTAFVEDFVLVEHAAGADASSDSSGSRKLLRGLCFSCMR